MDAVDAQLAQRGQRGLRGAAGAEHHGPAATVEARFAQRGDDPGDVGVSPQPPAAAEDQRVGRADGRGRGVELVGHLQRHPLQRHRQRQAGPLGPQAVDEPGQPGLVDACGS